MPAPDISNGKRFITSLWFMSMLLIFALIFAAVAMAAHNDCSDNYCSKSQGFAAVWNTAMCVAVTVFGTKVFRHYKDETSVGLLMGTLFVMSYSLSAQFVMFVGLASAAKEKGHDASADNAAAAFSFLLAVIYAALSGLVYKYRADVIGNTGGRAAAGSSSSSSSDAVVQDAGAAADPKPIVWEGSIVVSSKTATT